METTETTRQATHNFLSIELADFTYHLSGEYGNPVWKACIVLRGQSDSARDWLLAEIINDEDDLKEVAWNDVLAVLQDNTNAKIETVDYEQVYDEESDTWSYGEW